MRFFFSATTHSAYAEALLDDYKSAGTLPNDLVELTADEYNTYFLQPAPENQKLSADKNGRPCFVDIVMTQEELIASNRAQAKITLAEYIESAITLDNTDAVYQIDSYARENIDKSVALADAMGLSDDYSQPWKLLNNEWRVTTLAEIKHLKMQYLLRFKLAREALATWEAGDMLMEFTINE